MANHTLTYGLKARQFDTTDFQDPSVKRIIEKLSDIERAALSPAELEDVRAKHLVWSFFKRFRIITKQITFVYSTAGL